jgi:hypothetical protein
MDSIHLDHSVIAKLLAGPRHVPTLVAELSSMYGVTIQGVYKALRTLRKREVVTLHRKYVSLSGSWIEKEKDKLLFAEKSYRSQHSVNNIICGEQKKSTFFFHSLNEIDLFWTHAFQVLAVHVSPSEYTYTIQPHDWYYYVRFDTDHYWMKRHKEQGRPTRTVITHSGGLDVLVMRERKKILGTAFEYTLGENPLKQNVATYYNVLGSYVLTALFETSVAEELDTFVRSHIALPLSVSEQKEINQLVEKHGNFKLTIENNPEKAKRMREKVRNFFEF